jgi:hypothetical protein
MALKVTLHVPPPVAVMKSVSLIGKYQMQRKRNFEMIVSEFKKSWDPDLNKEYEAFKEKYGYWL